MNKLLVVTAAAALGIAASTAPLQAQASGPRPAPAEARTLQTLDHARRTWFEHAVDDILTGGERQAEQGGVLQGRSSDR